MRSQRHRVRRWREVSPTRLHQRDKDERRRSLTMLLAPLASPGVAGLLALAVYLVRASLSPTGLQASRTPYFTYLADAFLHGQLSLRLSPPESHDLIVYAGQTYLYWPPLPAILVMPLVALFGVSVSDVAYTAIFAAITIALFARMLAALDSTGVAPLTGERRAILTMSIAFGSVVLILAPQGSVWFTGQIIGWGCVLLASLAALTQQGTRGYFLTGLALAGAMATRLSLLFAGVWLAYYLLRRDWRQPWRRQLPAIGAGLAPIVAGLMLMGWYNVARFGNPLEMGLAWHNMDGRFQAAFERYGAFSLHYVPTNFYYQFIAHPFFMREPNEWMMGGGLFWMTPIFCGALSAVWVGRRSLLVWSLVLSCILLYIPIGLLMGTGWITYGPRYLLDLMAPLSVLTALGIRRWPLGVLMLLLVIGCATYAVGSWWWLEARYAGRL